MQPKKVRILHKQNDQINVDNISNSTGGIPPKSYLSTWKKEIEQVQKSNSGGVAYVECNLKKQTRYDNQAVDQLLKVHTALDLSKEVQRELDWYAEIVDWPADVKTRPQQQGIKQFQNLLYSSRFDAILPDYGMAAGELSKLCCTRWLSCDHMDWMIQEFRVAYRPFHCQTNYTTTTKTFKISVCPKRRKE